MQINNNIFFTNYYTILWTMAHWAAEVKKVDIALSVCWILEADILRYSHYSSQVTCSLTRRTSAVAPQLLSARLTQ